MDGSCPRNRSVFRVPRESPPDSFIVCWPMLLGCLIVTTSRTRTMPGITPRMPGIALWIYPASFALPSALPLPLKPQIAGIQQSYSIFSPSHLPLPPPIEAINIDWTNQSARNAGKQEHRDKRWLQQHVRGRLTDPTHSSLGRKWSYDSLLLCCHANSITCIKYFSRKISFFLGHKLIIGIIIWWTYWLILHFYQNTHDNQSRLELLTWGSCGTSTNHWKLYTNYCVNIC